MKIYLGKVDAAAIIRDYCTAHNLKRVTLFGEPLDGLDGLEVYQCSYTDSIMYKHYYKYLSFTDANTLFVWRDCLKTQKRSALEYNCIRQAAEQTKRRLVFQTLPIIKERDDFLTVYELIQPNTFVKMSFDGLDHLQDVDVGGFVMPKIDAVNIKTTDAQKAKYEAVKQASIDAVKRDADIIPRRCLKYAESLAEKGLDSKARLLSRDMRVSVSDLKVDTYFYNELLKAQKEVEYVVSLV